MTTGSVLSLSPDPHLHVNRMTGRYTRQKVPLVVRGVSRGSTETETETLSPAQRLHLNNHDPFSSIYSIYRDESYDKNKTTPVTSGRSSPTELCRASNYDWAAGNTTERSSLYSSYSWADDISWGDEYDRRASSNVRTLFEEVDAVLFAESTPTSSSTRSSNLQKECQEWMSQFPHLRVSGTRMFPQQDLGFQVIPIERSPPSTSTGTTPPSGGALVSTADSSGATCSNLLIDLTDAAPTNHDTQNLMLQGKHIIAKMAPRPLTTSADNDPSHTDPYAFLHEEILAQDGYYEEIIALDYKTEEESVTSRHPHRARAAKRGLPPLTPNACVRDSVFSMTFDIAWSEIVSWMRDVIKLYSEYIIAESARNRIPPLEMSALPLMTSSGSGHVVDSSLLLHGHHQLQNLPLEPLEAPLALTLTRDSSFAKSERRVPTAQSYFNGHTGQALAGVLTISTKALQSREKSNLQDIVEPQSSREVVLRPGSSLNRLVTRPSSVKTLEHSMMGRLSSARKGPTRVRLAPLDRAKTPNIDDDPGKEMLNQVLVGRRFQMFSEKGQNAERLSPPAYMFRTGALPPISLGETADNGAASVIRNQRSLKAYMSNRASSALAEKDIRQPMRERERSFNLPSENRPSTTHTFRSDTPFNPAARRSSTPLGFNAARGTLQSNYVSSGLVTNKSLGITGNSIGNSQTHDVVTSLQQHLAEDEDTTFHDLSQNWEAYKESWKTKRPNANTSVPMRRAGRQFGLSSIVR